MSRLDDWQRPQAGGDEHGHVTQATDTTGTQVEWGDFANGRRLDGVSPGSCVIVTVSVHTMARKYSIQYVDQLLQGTTYNDLLELSCAICSSLQFKRESPDYGLPRFGFLFVETLCWFAQAIRSGTWTYFEATPRMRQEAMLAALRAIAPHDLGEQYAHGMANWQDEMQMDVLDDWINANEPVINNWLRSLAQSNRDAVLGLTA